MTDPNTFSLSDTLAARELVKSWMHPAFHRDIEAGKLDDTGNMDKARAQVIRARTGEAGDE